MPEHDSCVRAGVLHFTVLLPKVCANFKYINAPDPWFSGKEKEEEGLLPVEGLNIPKVDSRGR